jgi:hypothetical protein
LTSAAADTLPAESSTLLRTAIIAVMRASFSAAKDSSPRDTAQCRRLPRELGNLSRGSARHGTACSGPERKRANRRLVQLRLHLGDYRGALVMTSAWSIGGNSPPPKATSNSAPRAAVTRPSTARIGLIIVFGDLP